MATKLSTKTAPKVTTQNIQAPELNTEVANRLRDPFETTYLGVLRTNDPLLLERGTGTNNFEIYRDLKRDGKVFSGLQKRKLALISRPWQVDPIDTGDAAKAGAAIVQAMLKALMFDKLCSELLDALLVGFVPSEVVWTVQNGVITPERVLKRAQRRFAYVQTDPNAAPELRLLTAQNMLTGEELPERKFIVHRFNAEDDNPYGMGLGLQLFWPVFFKRKGILSWNKLNDRFGSPTPWGKYPKSAGLKEKGTLFDALKAMSNDGVLITPDGMSIELLESKLTGSISTQKDLCAYMDGWIQEVILSQEPGRATGATAASANEREDVRLDLVQADADLLSDTLNSTLVKWICEYNGLAPCLVSRVIKKPEDLKAASETDKNIFGMGFRPTLDAIRAKYGEGWEEAPVPPPAATAPAPAPGSITAKDGQPASFAEPGLPTTPADAITQSLGKAGDAVLAVWMQKIAAMVSAAPTPAALRDQLLQAYGDLPTDQLAEVMTVAFAAAELAGMAAVADEAAQGD
jgi:phage gp29-like protein